MNLIRTIIEQHIRLDKPNQKGWYPVLCKVCNDHGKKGKRAAFLFTDHGCAYNCFNCGHDTIYDPSTDKNPSRDLIKVFDAFNIPSSEWNKLSLDALVNKYETSDYKPVTIEPQEISILPFFYPLTDDKNDDWCQYSIEYLSSRGIDWTTYPFYCVRKTNDFDNKKWYGRLIIPVYKDKTLIFYQGRDLTDMHIKKYLSATTSRDNVLYGYNQLTYSTNPLYVTEGWFDAYLIHGVAIFGNKLTQQQIMWLNRTNRPKVVIPDRVGDGYLLAEQAIQLGWKVSTLDVNDTSKDISDSICKYGLLYTLKTIVDNTVEGDTAKVITNVYCQGKRSKNYGTGR